LHQAVLDRCKVSIIPADFAGEHVCDGLGHPCVGGGLDELPEQQGRHRTVRTTVDRGDDVISRCVRIAQLHIKDRLAAQEAGTGTD
jgi:hypothetical protein